MPAHEPLTDPPLAPHLPAHYPPPPSPQKPRLRRVEQNWIFGHAAEVKRRSVHAALRHIRDTLKFNIIVVAVTRKDELMMIVDEAKEMGMWAG